MAILGVINVLPVPTRFPAEGASYQLSVPLEAAACNVTDPASQRLPGVVAVILGVAFTVAVTAVRVDVQVPLATST